MTEQIDGNEMNGENTTGGFNVDRLQSNQTVRRYTNWVIFPQCPKHKGCNLQGWIVYTN